MTEPTKNQTLVDYFYQLSETMLEYLVPKIQEAIPAMQALYDAYWQSYREAGMPYGETDEGLLRWAREVTEVSRLQFEAERILQHHQMLADFRRVTGKH